MRIIILLVCLLGALVYAGLDIDTLSLLLILGVGPMVIAHVTRER